MKYGTGGCAVLRVGVVFGLVAVVLSACMSDPAPAIESWEHVIAEENFVENGEIFTYRYADDRFNGNDWYDVWMDDSFWQPGAGYSRFVDVLDAETSVFMYAVSFHEGYIEFPSYGKELAGATLRFYRMPVR